MIWPDIELNPTLLLSFELNATRVAKGANAGPKLDCAIVHLKAPKFLPSKRHRRRRRLYHRRSPAPNGDRASVHLTSHHYDNSKLSQPSSGLSTGRNAQGEAGAHTIDLLIRKVRQHGERPCARVVHTWGGEREGFIWCVELAYCLCGGGLTKTSLRC